MENPWVLQLPVTFMLPKKSLTTHGILPYHQPMEDPSIFWYLVYPPCRAINDSIWDDTCWQESLDQRTNALCAPGRYTLTKHAEKHAIRFDVAVPSILKSWQDLTPTQRRNRSPIRFTFSWTVTRQVKTCKKCSNTSSLPLLVLSGNRSVHSLHVV